MERTGEFTEVPDEVIIRQLEYLDDPREMYSYVKALPPLVRDSVLTTLRESMVLRHREIYIEIYKTHFNRSVREAILHAAKRGHIDVLTILNQLAPKEVESVWMFSSQEDLETVRSFLRVGVDVHLLDDWALRVASGKGHYDVIRLLLEAGADVHAESDWALRVSSKEGNRLVVDLLLEAGADVHARDDEALQLASYFGHDEVVQVLLDAGADVHARSEWPLSQASIRGHHAVVRILLEAGADVNALSRWVLQTVLREGHPEVVRLLLDAGARLS
jgi:Ankyrin repeats (3 copies)